MDRYLMNLKYPKKWRETMDPFSIIFNKFVLKEILAYPHGANDIFYVSGFIESGELIYGYLKVERHKDADIEREILVIQNLSLDLAPKLVDYSLKYPRYILTEELIGDRISHIVGDNIGEDSIKYMEAYGELMAQIHNIKIDIGPAKIRNFNLDNKFYLDKKLEYILEYLSRSNIKDSKSFVHGDCHYGNILWKDYRVTGLLDFELSGYGIREYDLAWALTLRPGQKFLKTRIERDLFLKTYGRYHDFHRETLNYYMIVFSMYFYSISMEPEDSSYRRDILKIINEIIGEEIGQ